MFFNVFVGRTDLRKGVSGGNFDAESDFEVRFAIASQTTHENYKHVRSALFAICCSFDIEK